MRVATPTRASPADTTPDRRPLVLTLIALTLLLGVAGLAAVEPSTGSPELELVLLTLACAVPAVAALVAPRFDVLSPLFLVGFVFAGMYAARGWALYADHSPETGAAETVAQAYETHFEPAVIIAIVAVLGFFLGYLINIGPRVAALLPRRSLGLSAANLFPAGIALAVIGVPCAIIVALQNQGFFLLGSLAFALSEPLYNAASLVTAATVLLGIDALRRGGLTQRYRKTLWLGLVVLTILLAFISAEKADAIWALLTAGATFHYGWRRLTMRHVVAGFALFAVVLFPAIQTIRNTQARADRPGILTAIGRLPESLNERHIMTGAFRSGDFTVADYADDVRVSLTRRMFGIDTLVVSRALTPSVYPYFNGSTFERLPASFVPRALWADKPLLSLATWFGDRYLGRSSAYDTSTQATTFAAEFYLNFSVVGVAVGMFLLGLCYRFWYAFLAQSWSAGAITVYIVSLPSLLLMENDIVLSLRTGLNRVITVVVALLIAQYVAGRFIARSRSAL